MLTDFEEAVEDFDLATGFETADAEGFDVEVVLLTAGEASSGFRAVVVDVVNVADGEGDNIGAGAAEAGAVGTTEAGAAGTTEEDAADVAGAENATVLIGFLNFDNILEDNGRCRAPPLYSTIGTPDTRGIRDSVLL